MFLNFSNQNNYMNFLTKASFLLGLIALYIGLENLHENRDQSKDSKDIMSMLESHLEIQDDYLKTQNEILLKKEGKKDNGN